MRQFPLAPHPEIMRAEQRDEEYITDLCKRCDDVLWSCLGARWAIPYQHEIKLAGQALYYFLTTGMGIQTLGEEYSHITQVAGQSGLPSSPARRTFLVFVQILPSLAERLSLRAAARGMLLNSQNSQSAGMRENSSFYNGSCQSFLLQQWALILPSIREALLLLGRANLMLFYFRGVYYTVAKRMANVRYAYMGKLPQQRTRYHLLGVFLLIQLCITGSKWFKQNIMPAIVTTSRQGDLSRQPATLKGWQGIDVLDEDELPITERLNSPNVDLAEASSKSAPETVALSKCPLCLGPREWPTATPCGHVFCWTCVADWCNEKLECPLCRQRVTHSELVPIYNADF